MSSTKSINFTSSNNLNTFNALLSPFINNSSIQGMHAHSFNKISTPNKPTNCENLLELDTPKPNKDKILDSNLAANQLSNNSNLLPHKQITKNAQLSNNTSISKSFNSSNYEDETDLFSDDLSSKSKAKFNELKEQIKKRQHNSRASFSNSILPNKDKNSIPPEETKSKFLAFVNTWKNEKMRVGKKQARRSIANMSFTNLNVSNSSLNNQSIIQNDTLSSKDNSIIRNSSSSDQVSNACLDEYVLSSLDNTKMSPKLLFYESKENSTKKSIMDNFLNNTARLEALLDDDVDNTLMANVSYYSL